MLTNYRPYPVPTSAGALSRTPGYRYRFVARYPELRKKGRTRLLTNFEMSFIYTSFGSAAGCTVVDSQPFSTTIFMKRSFIRPALAVLTMVQLLLVGCSKESGIATPQPQKAAGQSETAYDYLGEQHNAGLEFFLHNAEAKDPRSQAEPLTIKFVETQGYNGDEAAHTFADPQFKEIATSSAPDEALRKYYEANGMKQELVYFDQFTKVLSNSSTADEAVEQLSALQETVAADNTLAETSQANLLKGIVVGKYSAKYWYAESLLGDKNPWTTTFGNSALKPWWGYAIADAIGYFNDGGIWGAIFASIMYGLP